MGESTERGIDEMDIIEEHLYETEFKLQHYGYGEWIEEPDWVDFEYRGYKCRITRVCIQEPVTAQIQFYGGHLCGYVQIPFHHPYHGMKYDEMGVDCHGGLNFAELCTWKGRDSEGESFWIGFDCMHDTDVRPSTNLFLKRIGFCDQTNRIFENKETNEWFKPTYKNMLYCIEQCKFIVVQLITAKEGQGEEDGSKGE